MHSLDLLDDFRSIRHHSMATHGNASEPSIPIDRGIVGDLTRWRIHSKLPTDFAERVTLACVLGEGGSEALFVTRDDEVWAFGTNADGLLGTGNRSPCPSPVNVTALSRKAVQTFAYSSQHVLALTGRGEVYDWGLIYGSEVEAGNPLKIFTPTLIYDGEDPALEIACGAAHSVCRTMGGAVFCWGHNRTGQLGIGSDVDQRAPRKVKGLIENLRCIGVSCTFHSTVAVFDNGEVFAWGCKAAGGFPMSAIPVKVAVGDAVIRKVTCGADYTLALANDGSLYVWGANDVGQLGLIHRNEQTPIHHSVMRNTYGRILKIAASVATSAAMTDNSKVLMWGCDRQGLVIAPTEVPCESLQDVFATLSLVPRTPVPLLVTPTPPVDTPAFSNPRITMRETQNPSPPEGWGGNFLNSIAEQFDNPTFSDVKFLVDSKIVYAHKTILSIQSDYFRRTFQVHWRENRAHIIKVSKYSYPVYKAFLKYFYTGHVDIEVTDTIELLHLADSHSEDALKMLCRRRVENMITIENFAKIYVAAIRHCAGDVEDFCFRFAHDNLSAITQTSGFTALPEDVSEKFFKEAARRAVDRLLLQVQRIEAAAVRDPSWLS